mmetsp:Transcript_37023/g.93888  ORF Transcript_37023/g.93888 Transcript_37023/m.93888 type:complete len:204 (+) Transcript_37023:541-1152(+)
MPATPSISKASVCACSPGCQSSTSSALTGPTPHTVFKKSSSWRCPDLTEASEAILQGPPDLPPIIERFCSSELSSRSDHRTPSKPSAYPASKTNRRSSPSSGKGSNGIDARYRTKSRNDGARPKPCSHESGSVTLTRSFGFSSGDSHASFHKIRSPPLGSAAPSDRAWIPLVVTLAGKPPWGKELQIHAMRKGLSCSSAVASR